MSIIKYLKDIEKELKNNIPTCNRGGCGVIAYYVGIELKKRDIKFTFRAQSPSFTRAKGVKKSISYNHIWISIGNYKFNQEHYLETHKFSKKHLKVLEYNSFYNRENNWNPKYNIKQNVVIEHIVKKHFNNYDISAGNRTTNKTISDNTIKVTDLRY